MDLVEGERLVNGAYGNLEPEIVKDSERGIGRANRAKYKVVLPSGYVVYFGDIRYQHFKGAGAGDKHYDTFSDEKRRANAIARMGVMMKKGRLRIFDIRDPVYWSARHLFGFDPDKDSGIITTAIERKNAKKIKPKVIVPQPDPSMIGSGDIPTKEVKTLNYEKYPRMHPYDDARIVIMGASGTGKTTLMTSEFLCNTDDPPYRWAGLYIFASMANHDDLYKALKKLKPRNAEGKRLPVQISTELKLSKINRAITPNSLVIIDDFSAEITRHKEYYQLLTTMRHMKSTLVLCCHDLTNAEKKARQNVNFWFFSTMSGDRLKEVIEQFLINPSETEIETISSLKKHEWVRVSDGHIDMKFVPSENPVYSITEAGQLTQEQSLVNELSNPTTTN